MTAQVRATLKPPVPVPVVAPVALETQEPAPEETTIPGPGSAIGRWLRLGPWYAMFPVEFAYETIQTHSKPGDRVLDPFMGRGTSLISAIALGRHATGIEIDPVAWVYASAKTDPAPLGRVLARLEQLRILTLTFKVKEQLPEFFTWAFHPDVLRFLLTARKHLNWENSKIDRTLMAILLVDLHGKEETSFSNQMRQTKAMAQEYSIRWWQARDRMPAQKNPVVLLKKKVEWRYAKGKPEFEAEARAIFGDSTKKLRYAATTGPYQLLMTSPPYFDVVNYNYDQWLRRWMLGAQPNPSYSSGKWRSKFSNRENYENLLTDVFAKAALVMAPDAHIVVRTDARSITFEATRSALETAFPNKILTVLDRPFENKTQTALFGDDGEKPGERDLVLTP
jgi:hypothetical protein